MTVRAEGQSEYHVRLLDDLRGGGEPAGPSEILVRMQLPPENLFHGGVLQAEVAVELRDDGRSRVRPGKVHETARLPNGIQVFMKGQRVHERTVLHGEPLAQEIG